MKTLQLNQMESLIGGKLSNRDCMYRGAGIVLGLSLSMFGGWTVALVLASTSSDCYSFN